MTGNIRNSGSVTTDMTEKEPNDFERRMLAIPPPMGWQHTRVPLFGYKPVVIKQRAEAVIVGGIKVMADPFVSKGEWHWYSRDMQFLNPADFALLKAELEKRATASMAEVEADNVFSVNRSKVVRLAGVKAHEADEVLRAKKALWGLIPKAAEPVSSYRDNMVDTIISAQCAAGGHDTPGTRAQAERWCAMLCECVCEGMRATTDVSAYRKADSDLYWVLDYRGKHKRIPVDGTPLGRP